jgi:hypothetical protein
MLKDRGARRAWRLYFLRAEATLSQLAAPVRRELIEDLKSHVRDILANDQSGDSDLARVTAALARVGNPREFLAPLVADAVFRGPPRHGGLWATCRAIALYAGRGTAYLFRVLGLGAAAAVGFVLAAASLNSLCRPDRAGLFLVGEDEVQIRVFGLGAGGGEQLLAPWLAALMALGGLALIAWAAHRGRRMAIELIGF